MMMAIDFQILNVMPEGERFNDFKDISLARLCSDSRLLVVYMVNYSEGKHKRQYGYHLFLKIEM